MEWRLPDGREVRQHTLRCRGAELDLIALGARVRALRLTDRAGTSRNVVLGHGELAPYLAGGDYLGATIGRYANRIDAGRCVVGGRELHLPANDRGNHLHGGPDGFDVQLWHVERADEHEITFQHTSPDGHGGYPGELDVRVTYRLGRPRVGRAVVEIVQRARSTARTIVAMTNHTYFNLDGADAGTTIDDHVLQVVAESYTPVRPDSIPTGAIAPVAGTPFDFRVPTRLGPRRLDHNLVLGGSGMREVAVLTSPRTGLGLRLATDQPGLQVYTGNHQGRAGVALEAQVFPDSPNHPWFPFEELVPGQEYVAGIRWSFDHDAAGEAAQPN